MVDKKNAPKADRLEAIGQAMQKQIPDAFLIGEHVYLRPMKAGDENLVARLENHPDPREELFYALPSTALQQAERLLKLHEDPAAFTLVICRRENREGIGQVSLVRIDWVGRMATYYIGIADKTHWGRGYGSEATRLMVDYAFDTLNLNRIQLHVSSENKRAIKVYEKIGFKQEGTLREAMYHKGRYVDFDVMGILRSDWEK